MSDCGTFELLAEKNDLTGKEVVALVKRFHELLAERPWSSPKLEVVTHAAADSRKVSIEVSSQPPVSGPPGTTGLLFLRFCRTFSVGNQRFNKFEKRFLVRDVCEHVVKLSFLVYERKPIISGPEVRRITNSKLCNAV